MNINQQSFVWKHTFWVCIDTQQHPLKYHRRWDVQKVSVCMPHCAQWASGSPLAFKYPFKYHLEPSRSVLFNCRSSADPPELQRLIGAILHSWDTSALQLLYGHWKRNAPQSIQSLPWRKSSPCFLKMRIGFKAMHSPFPSKGCSAVYLTPLLLSTQTSRAILLHN